MAEPPYIHSQRDAWNDISRFFGQTLINLFGIDTFMANISMRYFYFPLSFPIKSEFVTSVSFNWYFSRRATRYAKAFPTSCYSIPHAANLSQVAWFFKRTAICIKLKMKNNILSKTLSFSFY